MADIKFLRGTSADYTQLATKPTTTFYYLTDLGSLYLGDIKLSNEDILNIARTGLATDVTYKAAVPAHGEPGDPDYTPAVDAVTVYAAIAALEEAIGQGGSVADAIQAAIAELDTVADIPVASVSNNVVTIAAGIAEVDGVITAGSGSPISLEEVAYTGAAEDVSITPITGLYEVGSQVKQAADVQAAIAALKEMADKKAVYMVDDSANQSDYAKVYKIYQGAGSSLSPVQAELIGSVNIPKDKVVQDGSIVNITFDDDKLYDGSTDVTSLIVGSDTPTAADAGKYIKLILQNVTDPLYISVKDLVDLYYGSSNTEATVTIGNDNSINVAIGDISASKITYIAEDQSQSISRESVGAALARLDGSDSTTGSVAKKIKDAVEALDVTEFALAEKDSSTNVVTIHGISEADGEVAVGVSSANDITLAAVAATGEAGSVSIADAGSYTSETTVEGAIQEIYGKLQWASF